MFYLMHYNSNGINCRELLNIRCEYDGFFNGCREGVLTGMREG